MAKQTGERRLAATQARTELSALLREFAALTEASSSIGDRAVRLGVYKEDSAVLVPLADFERALEREEMLDDLLLELAVAERVAAGPAGAKSVEEVARDLGLAGELGLELSYRVEVWAAARADIAALPEKALQLAALRVALALREDPYLGESLRNRLRIGDLTSCRRVAFDRGGRQEKPRYRLIYRNDPNDGSIAVVQVVAVGRRDQLDAYKAAAERLREELRDRLA